MKNLYSLLLILLIPFSSFSQDKTDIQPTISPASFSLNTEITITYDVTGTNLASLSSAYLWMWLPDHESVSFSFNVNPANSNTTATDPAKFTKNVDGNTTTFSLTLTPADYMSSVPEGKVKLGMLLKGNDWANGQSVDNVVETGYSLSIINPNSAFVIVSQGEAVTFSGSVNESSTIQFLVDGSVSNTTSSSGDFSFNYTFNDTNVNTVSVTANNGQETLTKTWDVIFANTQPDPRPAGIVPGINYHDGDDTKVTLCLFAPGKENVFVYGEWSNWEISGSTIMNKDGDYFWYEVTGLTPGQEYAFQYLVDGAIYIADPFADKILDTDDQYIPAQTYPDLKSIPANVIHSEWYFNRFSVLQTAQQEYIWLNDGYQKPDKEDLIVYEVLIRDFFEGDENKNYQNLIDTLSYFKSMGVNAIELMPIMEFAGNNSWGYNPTFFFAPDKFYGTKNKLKEFIDTAHGMGIAVILDMVLNHADVPNPYVSMWFDFESLTVKPDNPYFNVSATHPFSVFYDFNHESDLTKDFIDSVNTYWVQEYHFDGYRFDLSKGFTQKQNSDVGAWSSYDDSRVAILKRMADVIWAQDPSTYIILEHFAANNEEIELSNYGMMLWGNSHGPFKEMILGFHDNNKSDISGSVAQFRGWSNNHLVSYMESHDEERQMVEAAEFGNSSGSYNIKNEAIALERIKAASPYIFLPPGPKMFWQFGELGYDVSIEFDGRTSPKPVLWNYYDEQNRKEVYNTFSRVIQLKNIINAENFESSNFSALWSSDAIKSFKYTSNTLNVVVFGNFGVTNGTAVVTLPSTGEWYSVLTDETINFDNANLRINLKPGEFFVLTDNTELPIESTGPTGAPSILNTILSVEDDLNKQSLFIYPNPTNGVINVSGIDKTDVKSINITNNLGQILKIIDISNDNVPPTIDMSEFTPGVYLVQFVGKEMTKTQRIIKN
ncbi:alpha-amylase family glycosyl hydrolase [Marinigracilibium pacificum]|uniref:T9SS type A sorting domain-containing protein n=1 Tax=Marinigracilibium pacificum TaxID=2729599 RepID=A0A848J3Y1_9BACT|nr:alpha-amylase family glycosyl hydrolase [Marinigracilibium pacificum]NMM50426.1 T9SS type A sorting domain-containing protein [Marinigracilibium pacificum]